MRESEWKRRAGGVGRLDADLEVEMNGGNSRMRRLGLVGVTYANSRTRRPTTTNQRKRRRTPDDDDQEEQMADVDDVPPL